MDSRIREALEKIAQLEQANCYATGDRLNDEIQTQNALRQCGDIARALLTAEPEPCEETRWVDPSDGTVYYSLTAKEYASVYKELTQRISKAQSASQVSDKRAEELIARIKDIVVDDLIAADVWRSIRDEIVRKIDKAVIELRF